MFPRAAPVHERVRPECAHIHRELKRDGVTLQLLWEEYAQVHPHGYRYTQFCGKRTPRSGWNGWVMRICGASAAPDAVWSSDEGCGRGSCTSGPHWILARLRDETFFSLGALNQAIRVLLDELNDRPLKKLGVSRRALYEQLDRPGLQPLPATRYVLAQWRLCRLNIDYHVIVERHAYSVPFQLLREQVEIRYTTTTVAVFFKGRRVSSHRRRYDGQPSTVAEHMPSAHRAHAEWTPSRLIRWAEKVGPATGELVARILESRPHPEQGYKAVLGLMRLGRQYGNPRLDAASARAIALGSCRFHTVKNILATGQDRRPLEPPAETAPTPTHANIRNADYYAATNEEDRC